MSLTEDHQFAQAEAKRLDRQKRKERAIDLAWDEFSDAYAHEIIDALTADKPVPENLRDAWRRIRDWWIDALD